MTRQEKEALVRREEVEKKIIKDILKDRKELFEALART